MKLDFQKFKESTVHEVFVYWWTVDKYTYMYIVHMLKTECCVQ